MTNNSTGLSDSKMIERILNTQETILEKQSDMGEQLAKMPGLWEGSMRTMLAAHEKSCEKKGISIFRLRSPIVFSFAAFLGLVYLIHNINTAYNYQVNSTQKNTSQIEFLKHTVDSIKSESGTDG